MSVVKKLSLAFLIALVAYALVMGVWSTALKYLALSGRSVDGGWEILERFAPSNEVAYALMAVTLAAIVDISWNKK